MSNLMELAEAVLKHPEPILTLFSNGTNLYYLHVDASALKELTGFAAHLETNPKKITVNLNKMPENCKKMLSEQTLNSLSYINSLDKKQKSAIVDEIKQCQNDLVNSILFKELLCASTLIIAQVSTLRKLSEELAHAANLVEESKIEIDRIIQKLDELVKMQTEMSKTLEEIEKKKNSADGSLLDQWALDQLTDDLNELINSETEIRHSLDQIKVKVNGKIISLGDQRNSAYCDAFVNGAHVLSNLIEYCIAGKMYTNNLKALKICTTSLFAVMGVLKFKQGQLTSCRIQELSQVMNQVVSLDREVTAVRNIIFQATRWIRNQKKMQRQQQQQQQQQQNN